MKLITFLNKNNESRIGWLTADNQVVDMQLASEKLPTEMLNFIDHHDEYFGIIKLLGDVPPHYSLDEVKLLAPLPNPRSIRDYIGFEMHMLNASRSFGHTVGEAWYQMPIFYFSNHHNVYGTNAKIKRPAAEIKLDIII